MSLPTGNHFGDPGALAIAAALRTNETITALSIFGARLCCLFQIGAQGCPHHKTLLGLLCSEFASRMESGLGRPTPRGRARARTGNEVADTGVSALAAALACNSALSTLGLRGAGACCVQYR